MKHAAGLFLVLAGAWLVLSGHLTPLLLGIGAGCCLLVVALVRRMGILDAEAVPLGIFPRLVRYIPYLLLEIVKANLDVARRVVDPRLPIRPQVFRIRSGQQTDLGRVLYANSITLTPGTVTIRLDGDELEIHALTTEAADGVRGGEMERRVRTAEGRTP
jgi:multicomponent Na+:H+ antiporter subunit E